MKPFTQNPNTSLYLITFAELMNSGVAQSCIDADSKSLRARVRQLQYDLNMTKGRKVSGAKLITQLWEMGYDATILSQLVPPPKQDDTRKEELAILATALRHLKTKRAEVTTNAQRLSDKLKHIASYMDADQLQAAIHACEVYKESVGAFVMLTKEEDERYILIEKGDHHVQ